MKKNIFFGMSVILIITCAIVFSCYLISKKLIPIPGNNSMKDVSSTTTEPPELMASVITPDESCITGKPSPPHLENELEMYVLQKVDDDLYQNKDMFFRVDNDGTLYIKNYSGEYDIFCNAEKPGLHTAVEAVPEDIHSRYKEIMNEYGKRKQLNFNGLNDYYYICSYEDYDYFELKIINGAGSGEYWGGKNSGIYLGIHQTTGELKEFGDFRAGYCKEKDNWVYYIDLINYDQDRAKDFPVRGGEIVGIGRICRMRPDTGENQVLSKDVAVNGFQFHDNKIYYVSFNDNSIKAISIDGKELYYTNRSFVFDEPFFKCPYTMYVYGDFLLFEEYGYDYEYSYIIITDDLSAFRKIKETDDAYYWKVLCTDENSIAILFSSDAERNENNILYLISKLNLSNAIKAPASIDGK